MQGFHFPEITSHASCAGQTSVSGFPSFIPIPVYILCLVDNVYLDLLRSANSACKGLKRYQHMKKAVTETSALVLIDHQTGTMRRVGSVPLDRLKAHTRALAKAAIALDMPIVLTSSMEDHAQGPLMPELADIAPEAFETRIKRPGVVNCWDDPEFANACRARVANNSSWQA